MLQQQMQYAQACAQTVRRYGSMNTVRTVFCKRRRIIKF